jgi:GNAT superfamily N-acetyltransferase
MNSFGSGNKLRTETVSVKPVASQEMTDTSVKHHGLIRVKELSERDRRRLLMHFLALDKDDRLLRFGTVLSDTLVTRYVQRLDFNRDTVFGVFDGELELIGVGHLAFIPCDLKAGGPLTTKKPRVAELGVSVSLSSRGQGIGVKLFERAAIHCRNEDVDTLFMHCLSSNQTMMHIAKKAGMDIRRSKGEADAFLILKPANPGSLLKEAVEEQVAIIDYIIRANSRVAARWLSQFPGTSSHVNNDVK